MHFLLLPKEKHPINRPMLSELWNKEISAKGHKIYWVVQSEETTILPKILNWEGNEVYLIPKYGKAKILRPLNMILELLGKFIFALYICIFKKISLIHIHNGPEEGMIGCCLSRLFSLPLVYTYTWPFIETIEKYILKEKKEKKKYLHYMYFSLIKLLYKMIIRKADAVFPISDHLKKELIEEYGLDPKKFIIVSESASNTFLDYRYEKPNNEVKKLIYVGVLSKRRKMDFLIDAFEIVKKRYQKVDLVILGWADRTQDVIYLKEYTELKGLSSYVTFVDKVPYNRVPEFITQCDIGVSPYRPIDINLCATPTKCIEYMSLHLPVVANREIYDQKYVIQESKGGVLADYTPDSFAEGILYLLENENERTKMGENGYNWVKNNRTFKKTAEIIMGKIDTLV